MATKKSTSAGRKSSARKAPASSANRTKTKVTTVRAASASRGKSGGFKFSRSPLLAAAVAEFVGTFLLAGVVLATQNNPIYMLFGVVAIVLAVGAVSGAHLNPALTVGAWVTRKIQWPRAVVYIAAQVLGALLALVVINAYVTGAPEPSAQAQMLGQSSASVFQATDLPSGKEWAVLGAEVLGVGIWAFAVASTLRENRERMAAAFTVGGGLFLGLMVAGTSASYLGATSVLNPAVAFSVQAVSWSWWPIFVYVVSPLVGGVIGWALYDLLRSETDNAK